MRALFAAFFRCLHIFSPRCRNFLRKNKKRSFYKKMKAVILAGGRGTRLAPVTHGAVPKPMAELLGAPMLEHIVALLKRCGFRDLCCTTACLPEQI